MKGLQRQLRVNESSAQLDTLSTKNVRLFSRKHKHSSLSTRLDAKYLPIVSKRNTRVLRQ